MLNNKMLGLLSCAVLALAVTGCSKEKMESALLSLGYDDLLQLLQKEGKAEVHCQFCRDTYTFNRREIKAILATIPHKKRDRHDT